MPRGLFLSLDGLDGTGKSTQCRMLVERLRAAGLPVTACADPGGTELGAKLRELLLFGRDLGMSSRAEALLFMASRAELVERVIRPALDAGQIVVSDRFALANVVYQGHAGGLNPDDLWQVAKFCTNDIFPDFTIVFDLAPEVAAARRGRAADRLERRGEEYHRRVREGFLVEVRREPDRIKVIDASCSAEAIHQQVWAVVREMLRVCGFEPAVE